MDRDSRTVLDHLENIEIEPAAMHRFSYELEVIRYLREGLEFLALMVSRTEVALRKRVGKEKEATALTREWCGAHLAQVHRDDGVALTLRPRFPHSYFAALPVPTSVLDGIRPSSRATR